MVTGGSLATVLTWLESNFHLKTTVENLAERACMSPRNFARTFLRETGTTPAKYIDLIRLEHAIRLLEDTNQPIAAIAVECGYSSTEHLRRPFQKHMGISPNALANIMPATVADLVDAFFAGDFEKARRLHLDTLKIGSAMFIEGSPVPVKTALGLMGKAPAYVRLPLCPLEDANKARLAAIMKDYNII